MFDQVKPEIVLPRIDAFRFHQGRYASHFRRLPHREIMLSDKLRGFEVGVPVQARRLDAESSRFHVLFCLNTSAASASGAKTCAIRLSSDKTRAALDAESATPASFNTAAMCAWYCARSATMLGEESM